MRQRWHRHLYQVLIMVWVLAGAGTDGQLGAVDSGDSLESVAARFADPTSSETPDFQKHVVPMLGKLGCSSAKCHGSFQGQGGLRLSLFGFDFNLDQKALTDESTSDEGKRINLKNPEQSLILLKPTEQVRHKGGNVMQVGSWEYNLLKNWIASGANGVAPQKYEENDSSPDSEFSEEGLAFYRTRIAPILEDNCYECHGFNERKGGLQLKTRDMALNGGDSGPAFVPGSPDLSLMIQAVRHLEEDFQMPPKRKLKDSEIKDLEAWVTMGAPWPASDIYTPVESGQVLAELLYEPEQIIFDSKDPAPVQIRIIAVWESGELEEVTALTRFTTNNDNIAEVNASGLVSSSGSGDTHIVATYDNGVIAIPVIRPFAFADIEHAINNDNRSPLTEKQPDNPIDQFVLDKLDKLNLHASELATDEEFLRRLSIDLTGSLPSPEEILAFLQDPSPDKRDNKIDELLQKPSYAAWWANKICDFTGCNPKSIRSNLEEALEEGYVKASEWYDWIYEGVSRNEPYDRLVEGIMLADIPAGRFFKSTTSMASMKGNQNRGETESIRDNGMPYFWTRQSLEKPQDTAMSVAHSFLGIQLQCAECHKHPFDQWTQNDFADFSSFFNLVTGGRRASSGSGKSASQVLSLLRSGRVELSPGTDPRKPIMDWMRNPENPWFARAFVNRVWAGYFHVGIVEPPDQFTPANPPSHPKLLDWLTSHFIRNNYDMKWLHRQITSSHTYQRSWKPNATNREDRRNFSRAIPRRIPAEVVYDAMKQATAADSELEAVRKNLKRRASGHLSMRMAGTHAMKVFGKPDRSINCDCERVNEPTLLQAIFTQNDPLVRLRIMDSGWIIDLEDKVDANEDIDLDQVTRQLWLRTVNRLPSEDELARAREHISSVDSIVEGASDLLWAMMNTKEFLLNH